MEKSKLNKLFLKDYEMKLKGPALYYIATLLLSIGSLCVYCGVLKERIHVNQLDITKLKAEVVIKDKELKAEIDKKVDITFYNEAHQNMIDNFNFLREDNKDEHTKIENSLDKIDNKIDKLIEREIGEQ